MQQIIVMDKSNSQDSKSKSSGMGPTPLISPPVTPKDLLLNCPQQTHTQADSTDPVLFPGNASVDGERSSLFPISSESRVSAQVTKAPQEILSQFPEVSNNDDEQTAWALISLKSGMSSVYNSDPYKLLQFLRKERRHLPQSSKLSRLALHPPSPRLRNSLNNGRSTNSRVQSQRIRTGSMPSVQNPKSPKRTFKSPTIRTISASVSDKRPRCAGECDFQSIPDYCPSTNTLARALSSDYRAPSGLLDLSSDIHRHLLHDKEVHLASQLRLTCAQYLCCKRRIFEAKVKHLRRGANFGKTHAQTSCHIDVNKASKLWEAFDREGWFKQQHFERFLVA